MEKQISSLEKFMGIVEEQHPQIKKYITSKTDHEITIVDPMGDSTFGSNSDLSVLFETTNVFPIKSILTSYKEYESCFIIKVNLR